MHFPISCDIPRLLNQELRERKQHKKAAEPPPKVVASSSGKTTARLGFGSSSNAFDPGASDPWSEPNRGEKRKDGHSDTPSPSTTLAQGLPPMLDGDVLHPFCPQGVAWDDLWLEQDQGNDLRVFVNGLRDKLVHDADKQAVSEVASFIMLLKKNIRAFQHKVDWKNPSSRVRTVIDRASRATAPIVASTPPLKSRVSSHDAPRRRLGVICLNLCPALRSSGTLRLTLPGPGPTTRREQQKAILSYLPGSFSRVAGFMTSPTTLPKERKSCLPR
jgi:hypothetical protein